MRIVALGMATLLFLIACNQDKSESTLSLQRQVSALEYRLDSLIRVLSEDKIISPTTITKQENITKHVASRAVTRKTNTSDNYSGQCMAITKKGTRCSRRARSNGYCWQHGG